MLRKNSFSCKLLSLIICRSALVKFRLNILRNRFSKRQKFILTHIWNKLIQYMIYSNKLKSCHLKFLLSLLRTMNLPIIKILHETTESTITVAGIIKRDNYDGNNSRQYSNQNRQKYNNSGDAQQQNNGTQFTGDSPPFNQCKHFPINAICSMCHFPNHFQHTVWLI